MHVFPRGLRGDDTVLVESHAVWVSEGLGSLVGAIGCLVCMHAVTANTSIEGKGAV